MSRRICLAAVVVLLTAAASLGLADLWVPAGLCSAAGMYFAGRCDYHGRLAEVTAERDAARAREQRLDDDLNDRWRLRTNAHRSASVLFNRNSTTTTTPGAAVERGAARAGVRPARSA